jgi:hypothetical protein
MTSPIVSFLKTPWQLAREYYHRRPQPDFDWSFGDAALRERARPHVEELRRDGIAFLPGYFRGAQLERLKAAFERAVAGRPNPHSPDSLINLAFMTEDAAFLEAALDDLLLEIVAGYYQKKFALARVNATRLAPTEPLRDGSYQWHHDARGRQVHLMILLNDLAPDGQRMSYLRGSHTRYYTHARAHAHGSRFEEEMAVALGKAELEAARVAEVIGPAGTAAIFDANGLHSGNRNRNGNRDTLIFAYVSQRHFKPVAYRKADVERLPAAKRQVLSFNPYAQLVD